jgi:hypothetical protein
MGTDESCQQAATAATDGGEEARRHHPVVSGLLAVAVLALAGAVALIWFLLIVAGMRSGPQDGPYVVDEYEWIRALSTGHVPAGVDVRPNEPGWTGGDLRSCPWPR